ncbi:MAG TPA: hypothetical protein VFO56_03580 [Gaiellaceae bacterium]|nr:hypothetical protein [Gaiellaceae bacterium]
MLERALGAERVVLEGFGHTAQRHLKFNDVLVDFVERARAPTSRTDTSRRGENENAL